MNSKFTETINRGYATSGESVLLGCALHEGKCDTNAQIKIPLKTLNRHGLIAGATGTGKTKTLQLIAELLSMKGIPSVLMDIKGDLSGLAAEGEKNGSIEERHNKLGIPWESRKLPVEFLTISGETGTRLRATVIEFGPVLFSKILGLNDTQSGVVSMVFKYCDDNKLLLLDLADFRKALQFLTGEGRAEIEKEYGRISTTTTATIMRKLVEIEQQDADRFFGEFSFDISEFRRTDNSGWGYQNILRLTDIQDRPKLFSTFMLNLLGEVYATFPEAGDMDRPKLVLFIDEAHLIFKDASKILLEQLETIIRLIRSKGVGVFFITQQPTDIPPVILSQLGLKIQHALRAFTAMDRKQIKSVVQNYPDSEFYDVEELLTTTGIGEALITVLDEKGIPTPLVHTLLCAPGTRMGILTAEELEKVCSGSQLATKYNEDIDRRSACEILTEKLEGMPIEDKSVRKPGPELTEKNILEEMADSTAGRQVMRTVTRELTRGLLGMLGVKSGNWKRNSTKWF